MSIDTPSITSGSGLVKVGFTAGTPDERAAQLNGTHSPHPVVVEYSTQVPDARAVEREAHLRLRKHREGKEWFRCSRELAIDVIKHAAGDLARNEFSRVEQERQQAGLPGASPQTAAGRTPGPR